MSKRQKREPRFYRILSMNKPSLSRLSLQPVSPQKLTQQIVKNKHYVYIDVNSQSGLCEMQQINPQEADQDAEFLAGNNYLCGISSLPQQSQKTIDYVYKLQQLRKQRQKFKQLIRDQIRRTVQKRAAFKQKKKQKNRNHKSLDTKSSLANQSKPQKSVEKIDIFDDKNLHKNASTIVSAKTSQKKTLELSVSNQNVILYRGMQTNHLRSFLERKELEHLNAEILEKEKLLIAKYGFTNQFQSITKQKSFILRKNRKIILPQIKSQSKYIF